MPSNGVAASRPISYLPGTQPLDPRLQKPVNYGDVQEDQARASQAGALDRAQQSFYGQAANNPNYSMSWMDPRSGMSLSYKPGEASDPNAFTRKMGQFDTFMSKYGRGGGGSASLSGTGGLSGGAEPRVQLDTNAIQQGDAAAYSRAKDQVGQSQQGLMKALTSQFAGRGLRGSSIEGRELSGAAESGAGQLADVSRSQAIEGGRRAVDMAKTQYGGEITQRGQDMDAAAQVRGLEAQAQQSKLSSVLGLWNAFSGLKY